MHNDVDTTVIKKTLMVLRVVWLSMFISLIFYFFIAKFLIREETISKSASLLTETTRIILYAISILTIASIRYLLKFIMEQPIKQKTSSQTSTAVQHPVIAKYTIGMMVSLALAESVGVYGFVLGVLGKSTLDLCLLLLVSGAAILYYRPKEEELSELLRRKQTEA